MSVNAQKLKSSPERSLNWTNDGMIGLMRLILASSALVIIYIDPSEPDRNVAAAYTILILYTLYSAALLILILRRSGLKIIAASHWLDVAWSTALIGLSSGTNSIFFLCYFFPILVASSRWGFGPGLRVVLTSGLLFIVVGYLTSPPEPIFELNRFLLRPIYLLVIGYFIAYQGGSELTLKRRLALLKEVTSISNPRFGVDQVIGSTMEKLIAFYGADSSLLITRGSNPDDYFLRTAYRDEQDTTLRPERASPELTQLLLSPSPEQAIIHCSRARWLPRRRILVQNVVTGERVDDECRVCGTLATALDADSFITVPVARHRSFVGRLYVAGKCRFTESDIDFIRQLIEHFTPIIENIRLVDRLTSDAAEQERKRVARDLHDSVIQPFIGLQLGLAAIKQKLEIGGFDIKKDTERLYEITSVEVDEIRHYIQGLKAGEDRENSLVEAVRRFANKFSEMTGISIEVDAPEVFRVNSRLAAEAFKMAEEGLSNIRRHTSATHAGLNFSTRNGYFVMEIENNRADGMAQQPFIPRSLSERAKALGGEAQVDLGTNGTTRVVIEVPL